MDSNINDEEKKYIRTLIDNELSDECSILKEMVDEMYIARGDNYYISSFFSTMKDKIDKIKKLKILKDKL